MDRFSKKKENFAFSEKKRALLALRLSKEGTGSSTRQGIARRKADDIPVLSFAQQRLWFLEQLKPGNAIYNVPIAIHLSGLLHTRILAQSLDQIIERHEILRTTIKSWQEVPVQIIAPVLRLTLPIIDLSSIAPASSELLSRTLADQEASVPFDLERGPLLRAKLLRLASDQHVLLLTMHHIVTDGWSTPILLRELYGFYQRQVQGKSDPLPPLVVQYADYALWQRQWLQGAVLQEQLDYWRTRLAQLPILVLPLDHPRPRVQSFAGTHVDFRLTSTISTALQALSQREGVTLFMTLLAAFQIVLMRWSGQEDLAVGTPIANRTRPELEGMIGFFVNTLVLRTDLSGQPSFVEALRRVRETCLGAYAHQDVPFEQVVEALHPTRDLSRSPLFQVLFTLQNASGEVAARDQNQPAATRELQMRAWGIESEVAKFDLTLEVQESEQGLHGQLGYNRELFEQETIQRLLGYWQKLLEGAVSDPRQTITTLPLLTIREQARLLELSRGATQSYPREQRVHQLIEERAARTPEAIALVREEEHLSYRELNIRANRLAHLLRQHGVGPETRVGLCLERGLDLVIALLAILKAGGAYVPLDPAYPTERLHFMLQDAEVALLLTMKSLEARFTSAAKALLCLDVVAGLLGQQKETNPGNELHSSNLAYVIYTSGSTGRPKGVAITHRNLQHLVNWHNRTFEVRVADRATHLAGLGFDASGWELWPYLVRGASLHLVDDETRLSPQLLHAWLQERQITLSFVPTPLLEELLGLDWSAHRSLRLLLTGGDVLHRRAPTSVPFALINNYGPTECSVVASSGPVGWQEETGRRPDLGQPLPNTQLYLLDEAGQLVPQGSAGEVYIGGAGVGRGYLGRADLTAERFVPDPLSGEAGARLYRTGDRMRYLADGTLEFLGRLDQQVKIRGFRIELGEIETVFMQQNGIQAAVVESVQKPCERDELPDIHLVAFVVRKPQPLGHEASAEELLESLRQRLPVSMLPSIIHFLESLPLNEAGKVNRKALPSLEWSDEPPRKVLPRTSTEKLLAGIWQNVLGIDQVGVHDNFFSIGGHSMLAVRLVNLMQEVIGKKLSLATLFQYSTIEEQARVLLAPNELASTSSLVRLRPYGAKSPLFCMHPKGGYVFSYADLVQSLDVDRPVYGLQARDIEAEEGSIDTSIEEMAAYYIGLMQTIQMEGPYYLCGYSMGGLIAFEIACQLQAQGQQISLLCLLDCDVHNADIEGANDPDERVFLVNEFSRYFPLTFEDLKGLDSDEQLYFILEQARRANALAPLPDLGLPRMRRYVEVARTHVRAAVKYRPGVYQGRILAFSRGENQRDGIPDSALEWGKHATDGVDVYAVPGEHLTTMRPPAVYRIARQLQERLDEMERQA